MIDNTYPVHERFHTIYGLVDPRDQRIKYIGKAANLRSRISRHLNDVVPTNTPKKCWIYSLATRGLRPTVKVLEKCPSRIACRRERHWIRKIGRKHLKNQTDGGDGGATTTGTKRGPTPEAVKLKISRAKIGRPIALTPAQLKLRAQKILQSRIRNGTTNKGRTIKFSPETIKRFRAAARRRVRTPEGRAQIIAARYGKTYDR